MGKLIHGGRVYANVNHGSGGGSIEVIRQLAERVSSSSSRIVTSSDASSDRLGWCAFNGIHPTNLREPEANTCWFAASNDTTPYIQYDLLNSYRLSQVRIDCFSNYSGAWTGAIEVLGSTDGSSWTNILKTGTSAPIEAALQTITSIVIDLNSSSYWRYIRIKGESAFDVPFAPSLFIDEIFIYGYVIETAPVIDLRFTTWDSLKRIENTSCMAISTTETILKSTYIGGVSIGCNFTIPIDVSDIDSIHGTVDIGTGYSLTQFPFYVALCEQYPNNTASTPSSWSPAVQDTTNVANSTYDFSLDTSNLRGGYFLVFILTGINATVRDLQVVNSEVSSNYTNTDYYTQSEQITDISNFTKLYSTESSVSYGSQGTQVASALSITNESTLNSYMNEGWNSSHAAYYGSEDRIGAYAGYNFGIELPLKKVKLWLGRYSGQNKSLIVTLQILDGDGNWHDIKTIDISSSLPYPLNVFEIDVNKTCYGIRWIHSSGEQKNSGNNIVFFGMTIYKGTDNAERVYVPTEKVNYIPTGYSGFGTVVIDNDALINELYSFDQSQGGVWINTNVDVSDLNYILFTYSGDPAAPDDRLMRQMLKSNIVVYTGGPDVYTTIFTQVEIGAALNVRIYNNILWVSFNGTGPNTKVVTIYNPITF